MDMSQDIDKCGPSTRVTATQSPNTLPPPTHTCIFLSLLPPQTTSNCRYRYLDDAISFSGHQWPVFQTQTAPRPRHHFRAESGQTRESDQGSTGPQERCVSICPKIYFPRSAHLNHLQRSLSGRPWRGSKHSSRRRPSTAR